MVTYRERRGHQEHWDKGIRMKSGHQQGVDLGKKDKTGRERERAGHMEVDSPSTRLG